jgi:hypothetical protein
MLLSSGGGTGTKTGSFVGVGVVSTTEAIAQQVMPSAGHFTSLYCNVNTTPDNSTHSDTFQLSINGVLQALTCTITGGGPTQSQTTGASIAFAAGALVDVKFTSTSGGGGATPTISLGLGVAP